MKEIRSLDDFIRKYLPEEYNRQIESEMTPTELGAKRGSEFLQKAKKILTE